MDNQHRKIKTYRELNQDEIDLMNEGKELGAKMDAYIQKLESMESNDQRCVAIGKTNLQQGLMWAIRGIAQPTGF